MDKGAIEQFIHAQVRAWNAGDRDAFLAAYRAAAPTGLQVEYVGRPACDGWPVLEGMWAQQSAKIEIEEVVAIVNGQEAACHNRNKIRGTTKAIDTIELYRFDKGRLQVRYFILPPEQAMTAPDNFAIERFMKGQVACWNAHDKAGFMAHYREMAPQGLEIEYVGRDEQADGWLVIEEMWDKHNPTITLDVVSTIVNGHEAAVHHRNCIVGTDQVIESLETYRFEAGRLLVRYFLKPPAAAGTDLAQFRGFAAA